MSKVTFDWENKLIIVNSWVTDIDVEKDLYSEWKKWSILDDNLKYLSAFRTIWGDPTSWTNTAPKFFFLQNWWILKVEDLNLNIATNLYSDDYNSPFIIINSSVSNKTTDSQIWNISSSWLTTEEHDAIINTNSLSEKILKFVKLIFFIK